jgi:CBS domain-containing protein
MYVSKILDAKGNSVITIDAESTLSEAVKILAERGIGAIVVTDEDNRILGILSERDIVSAVAQSGSSALNSLASEHMTREVRTTHADEAIRSIMEQMTTGRFRHMPVVDGGRMVGIISIGDVVKQRLADFEAETSAMRDYIAST